MHSKPIFIKHANQMITLKGSSKQPLTQEKMSELHIIEDGAVWIEEGRIKSAGTTAELQAEYQSRLQEAEIIDATGKILLPGLVDPHTHLVYAGSREEEFNMRLNGATYMEIMNNGGGIHATTS